MDISQTVTGLTAGEVMELQFDHANRTTGASGSFEVYWNNTLVATITDSGGAMQTKTYQVAAVAGNNTLRFKGIGTVDALGASIDNVRLYATQTLSARRQHGHQPDGRRADRRPDAAAPVRPRQPDDRRKRQLRGLVEQHARSTRSPRPARRCRRRPTPVTAIAGNNTLRFKGTGTADADGASIDNVRLLATVPVPSGGNMDISQTVGGLTAGQIMQLQFDHANRTTARAAASRSGGTTL